MPRITARCCISCHCTLDSTSITFLCHQHVSLMAATNGAVKWYGWLMHIISTATQCNSLLQQASGIVSLCTWLRWSWCFSLDISSLVPGYSLSNARRRIKSKPKLSFLITYRVLRLSVVFLVLSSCLCCCMCIWASERLRGNDERSSLFLSPFVVPFSLLLSCLPSSCSLSFFFLAPLSRLYLLATRKRGWGTYVSCLCVSTHVCVF